MKTSEFKKLIREEVKKALNEGALVSAIKPGVQGEVKVAVEELEKALITSLTYAGLSRNAKHLAKLVKNIIDAAKNE